MKLTTILFFCAVLQANAGGYAQKVTLSVKNAPLETVFKDIKKQTGYLFFYNVEWLQKSDNVSIEIKDIPLEQALELLFKDQPFDYSIVNKTVVIKEKDNAADYYDPPPSPPVELKGTVADEKGVALEGVSIKVKGTNRGALTKSDGSFSISADPGKDNTPGCSSSGNFKFSRC